MSGERPTVWPMRGPLGWREVFFTRRTAPVVGLLRLRKIGIGLVVALCGLLGFVLWLGLREISDGDVNEFMWIVALPAWWFAEAIMGAIGARAAGMEVLRWKRQGRLEAVYLTLLRPIEIAQIILVRPLRLASLFVGLSYLAFAIALLATHPERPVFLYLFGLIALNSLGALYTGAWIKGSIMMATGKGLRGEAAFANAATVYILCAIPLHLILVIPGIWAGTFYNSERAIETTLLWIAPILLIAITLLKYLWARAHAMRLERIIMPAMEM